MELRQHNYCAKSIEAYRVSAAVLRENVRDATFYEENASCHVVGVTPGKSAAPPSALDNDGAANAEANVVAQSQMTTLFCDLRTVDPAVQRKI